MKPFEMPVIELEKFSVEDLITVSYGNELPIRPWAYNWEEAQKIKAY